MRPILFIATPCYGGLASIGYVAGLVQLVTAAASPANQMVVHHWMSGAESLIPRARNAAVADFLATDATHLLFVDADIAFRAEDVALLLQSDKPVVAGAYPIKSIDWQRAVEAHAAGRDPSRAASSIVVHHLERAQANGQLVQVKEAGTGFLLIQRAVIEQMIAAHPETRYTLDATPPVERWNLFHADIVDDVHLGQPIRRYLSEDYWFCRCWREMGGEIWLHLGVQLGHTGAFEYRCDPHDVYAGHSRGIVVHPDDASRVDALLAHGVAVPEGEPTLVVDHAAREGAVAVWLAAQYPRVRFDLWEPDEERRAFLRRNVATYGLDATVHDAAPPAVCDPGAWRVRDGRIETGEHHAMQVD